MYKQMHIYSHVAMLVACNYRKQTRRNTHAHTQSQTQTQAQTNTRMHARTTDRHVTMFAAYTYLQANIRGVGICLLHAHVDRHVAMLGAAVVVAEVERLRVHVQVIDIAQIRSQLKVKKCHLEEKHYQKGSFTE